MFQHVHYLPAPPYKIAGCQFGAGLRSGGHAIPQWCACSPLVNGQRKPTFGHTGGGKIVAAFVMNEFAPDSVGGIHSSCHSIGGCVGFSPGFFAVFKGAHADHPGEFCWVKLVPDSPAEALGNQQVGFVVDEGKTLPFLSDVRNIIRVGEFHVIHFC